MAERGDVLALKRRVGFGAGQAAERFVVVQADTLNEVLDTIVVVPLDAAFAYYTRYPGAVPVDADEAGTSRARVAVVTAVTSIHAARFEDAAVATVAPATLAQIDQTLAVVLDLP